MNRKSALITLFLSFIFFNLMAQSCESLLFKASNFCFSTSFDDYESHNYSEINVDSALFYNEIILSSGSCNNLINNQLDDLAFLNYLNQDYKQSKKYANRLISINSSKTITTNSNSYQYDSLEVSKYNAYKILGRVYVVENNEDSLNYIINKLDSLKHKFCSCGTCISEQNWFIKELRSDLYTHNKEYDKALSLWFSNYKNGHSKMNEKITNILVEKYGSKLKELIIIEQVTREKFFTKVKLKIIDQVVTEITIKMKKCDGKLAFCLSQIDYLQNIFK